MSERDYNEYIQQRYKAVFGTSAGKAVLADLLYQLGAFGLGRDEVVNNIICVILRRTGFIGQFDESTGRPTLGAYKRIADSIINSGVDANGKSTKTNE